MSYENLPQYQCHKKVRALRIKFIEENENPDKTGKFGASSYGAKLHFTEHPPIEVSAEYICKHNPQKGGYFVAYEDGYTSYSPADVFESGYSRC